MQKFSDYYKATKLRLLGHVIRAEEKDPMRQVTFEGDTLEPKDIQTRRRGSPKDNWLDCAMEEAWYAINEANHIWEV